MLTVREIAVPIDDRRAARAAAAHPLNDALAPRAFADPHERRGTGPDSMWLGTPDALSCLGLAHGAEVSADQLASAMLGRHVATGAQVVRPPQGRAVISLELTFAVPNSVSWAWCVGGIDVRAQIERTLWVTAVALLAYVARTKPLVEGREPALGYAASAVLHATVRKSEGTPPPLLHLHCHLVCVEDLRCVLRCPHGHALESADTVRECGAAGRAVLAEELGKLGFPIKPGTGYQGRYFEIAGVPQGLLRPEISARTECGGPVQEAQYGWPAADTWSAESLG